MKPFTSKQILKAVGSNNLELVKGEGYWYFVYDDIENNIYETKSIYCMFLNQSSFDYWVSDGKDFVQEIKNTKYSV